MDSFADAVFGPGYPDSWTILGVPKPKPQCPICGVSLPVTDPQPVPIYNTSDIPKE